MAVDSIASINTAIAAMQQSQRGEAQELKGAPDTDRDSDDSGVRNVQPPAPTVNAAGQPIGTLINLTA